MNDTASQTACQRCGRPAQGDEGNPNARLMRRAREGVCVDCAVVVFLQRIDNMSGCSLLPVGETWSTALRLPHVRDQVAKVMRAGLSDANPDEVDWDHVVELWNIVPKEEGMLW